jgi:hypothetical protein
MEATRLPSVTLGKFEQFTRSLDQAHLDGELLDILLRRQDLVNGMVGWVRQQLVPPAVGGRIFDGSDLVGWCGEPEEQLSNLRLWNEERGLGFAESAFPEAPDKFLPSRKHEVLVLVAYLPDAEQDGMLVPGYVRTFNEYSRVARLGHSLGQTADDLRLLSGTEARHEAGIRWMVVDMAAMPNTKPEIARDETSAGAEALAVFAQMPGYVLAQNWFNPGKRFWLAGYQLTERTGGSYKEAWSTVPSIGCREFLGSKEYDLSCFDIGYGAHHTFAPTVRPL